MLLPGFTECQLDIARWCYRTEVFAKYIDPNNGNWTSALTNFMASIPNGTAAAGTVVDGDAPGSLGNGTFPYAGVLTRSNDNGIGPKAYLNYIVFDRDYNFITGGFRRLSNTPRETGTNVAHERLAFDGTDEINITEPGYVYIYLSNENETPVEVFFDDFWVEHVKSPVVQMDDYYPFGLTFNSYSRENSVKNKYLFNSNELEANLGLEVYLTEFRTYDPTLGRLWQIDPIDKENLSPYAWAANNPILFIDLFGLDTLRSTDPNFNWSNVKPGDVVDGATVLDEAEVTAKPLSESERQWLYYVEGYGYYYPGEKVLKRRDGVPGLEDFFGYRQIGDLSFHKDGHLLGLVVTGTAPSPGSPAKLVSNVKKFSDLLRIARKVGTNPQIRAELNKLARELMKGNFGAGRGSKSLGFGGVHEMRGDNGARLYFRNTQDGFEILGYSDKATQSTVIESLRKIYGK